MTDHEMPTDFENQRDIAEANATIRRVLASDDFLKQVLQRKDPVLQPESSDTTSETDNKL